MRVRKTLRRQGHPRKRNRLKKAARPKCRTTANQKPARAVRARRELRRSRAANRTGAAAPMMANQHAAALTPTPKMLLLVTKELAWNLRERRKKMRKKKSRPHLALRQIRGFREDGATLRGRKKPSLPFMR